MGKIRNRDAAGKIKRRQEFDNHTGSFWARQYRSGGTLGLLPEEWRKQFDRERPTYVVYSYATPVAWWSADYGWTMPPVSYSRTTSRHQSIAWWSAA